MSNYNLQIPWSGKDSLGDTDPDKVVSGDDFNTEFGAVKIAINSKAELAGSVAQSFSATTANVGTNTKQVATTEFVTLAATAATTAAIVNALVYPVGSIYFNMAVATNPATLLGMGTWVAYATGQVLVGIESSGTFDALDESLGAETSTTGSHTLSISEMPAHTHTVVAGGTSGTGVETSSPNTGSTVGTSSTGGGGGHTHGSTPTLQPSVTVYIWKRTA